MSKQDQIHIPIMRIKVGCGTTVSATKVLLSQSYENHLAGKIDQQETVSELNRAFAECRTIAPHIETPVFLGPIPCMETNNTILPPFRFIAQLEGPQIASHPDDDYSVAIVFWYQESPALPPDSCRQLMRSTQWDSIAQGMSF